MNPEIDPQTPWPPHVQRMVEEEVQLRERSEKLGTFIKHNSFRLLPDEEQDLLRLQHASMLTYLLALAARLVLAKEKART